MWIEIHHDFWVEKFLDSVSIPLVHLPLWLLATELFAILIVYSTCFNLPLGRKWDHDRAAEKSYRRRSFSTTPCLNRSAPFSGRVIPNQTSFLSRPRVAKVVFSLFLTHVTRLGHRQRSRQCDLCFDTLRSMMREKEGRESNFVAFFFRRLFGAAAHPSKSRQSRRSNFKHILCVILKRERERVLSEFKHTVSVC